MKKLLYITANSKPENMSTSKTVGREFINRFKAQAPDYQVMELDLYSEYIPEVNHRIFTSRASLITTDAYLNLSEQDQDDVDRINQLCDQFLSADFYVIAAPMWSVNFPSILKKYIDCIVINAKTISITENKVEGLLDDKIRKMVYIQSSGGVYPIFISAKYNHGLNYLHDLFKFLGVADFEDVLVQGVDMASIGKEKAIQKAIKKINDLIPDLLWDESKLHDPVT